MEKGGKKVEVNKLENCSGTTPLFKDMNWEFHVLITEVKMNRKLAIWD
jgi:hypothetical protein